MHQRHLTALALALLTASLARADQVTLNDGTVLKGRVTIETDEKVVLQQDSKRLVLSRDQVASVEKDAFVMPTEKAAPAPQGDTSLVKTDIGTWPPRPAQAYPDLALRDCNGNLFRLSSLKGKVILVEPVAISCMACQAFSGGDTRGGFLGVTPQPGIHSLEEYLARFGGGVKFDNPAIAYVQVVIYNMNLEAPSVSEVKAWADHFGLTGRPNVHVLVGTKEMISQASFDMIPGLHLIGKDFILRSEHFGHGGGSDLYSELLPMTASLVGASN
jgi:hypothetical protein